MLLVDGSLSIAESTSLLLLLVLESLVASSILKHALRVLVSASLKLLMVLFSLNFQSLVKLLLNLVFASFELLNLTTD